jgi:hypothetical protein
MKVVDKTGVVLPNLIVNEPRESWVPIQLAPFCCAGDVFHDTIDSWQEAVAAEVERIAEISSQYEVSPPDWRVGYLNGTVWLDAYGISTRISAPHLRLEHSVFATNIIEVFPAECSEENRRSYHWNIFLDGFREAYVGLGILKWDEEVPEKQRVAAEWHRGVLESLLFVCKEDFLSALRAGEIQIVARKNSVLAPFEAVSWDQWQFFELRERPVPEPNDLRDNPWHQLSNAVGPNGESLYSIHVVAGKQAKARAKMPEQEQKCLTWLVKLLRDFPDRRPRPRWQLEEEAISNFEGLSKNAFGRCYNLAQHFTNNRNWSRAGRPPKIPSKITPK